MAVEEIRCWKTSLGCERLRLNNFVMSNIHKLRMTNFDYFVFQTDLNHDQPWISLAEISDETPNYERLNELRRQYLATTAQLKEDLVQHANETRNNAAKAIR